MVEGRRSPRPSKHHRAVIGPRLRLIRKDFESHGAFQANIVGTLDHTPPAAAQF